jgi:hypothetical protein
MLGNGFDYHETMVIKKYWEDWKAQIDIVGFDTKIKGHILKRTENGWDSSEKKTVKADLLLSQVDHQNTMFSFSLAAIVLRIF